jgi:CRP-like cAMP-binding protein
MIDIMSDLIDALRPKFSGEVALGAGETLFRRDDAVRTMHIVEAGCVHLIRFGEDGTSAVMQRAAAGDLLAESSVFASAYHCDAVAVSDARLRTADVRLVRSALQSDSGLLETFARHLGREVMRMRSRVEILRRRTVQDRLDGWFALNGAALPTKGSWRSIADDFGVSPEAFYRELPRRRSPRG